MLWGCTVFCMCTVWSWLGYNCTPKFCAFAHFLGVGKAIGYCFQAAATIVIIGEYENKQHFYLRSLCLRRQVAQVNIPAVAIRYDIIGI